MANPQCTRNGEPTHKRHVYKHGVCRYCGSSQEVNLTLLALRREARKAAKKQARLELIRKSTL